MKKSIRGFFSGFASGYRTRKALRLELERAERGKAANTRLGLLDNLKIVAGCGVIAFMYIAMFAVALLVVAAVIIWAFRTVFGP
jgi:hypothetical protein